jgi:hypothetical protein
VGLQRTGYGVKIALATAFALLVTGYGLFVAIYLTTRGHFAPFWSFETLASAFSVLVNLILMALLWANVRGLVVRRNQARALARRDPSVVSEASPQPAPSLALPAGETLTLACRHNLNTRFHNLSAIVYYAYPLIVGEIIVFQALPAFGHSALNPYFHSEFDGPPAPLLTTLDWVAAALPLLLTTCVIGYLAWRDIRDRLHRIMADDTGIAVKDGFRRRRIAWNDITAFARIADEPYAAPVGNYVLWGHSKSLNFAIVVMEPEIDPDTDYIPSWQTRYSFVGGYATYSNDAQCLLATIAARAQTPLLTVRVTTLFNNQRRGLPAITSLSETEALALPLAEERYAPLENLAGVALAAGEQLSLRARSGPLSVTGNAFGDFSLVTSMLYVLFWVFTPPFSLRPLLLVAGAIVIALLAFYLVLLFRQRRHGQLPDVRADETGLTTWGYYKDQPVTIPWDLIVAWVVISPTKPNKSIRYAVFGDGLHLSWDEPASLRYYWENASGDSHKQYREHAARLHTLIVARTGLPLRELRSDAEAVPATQA